MLTQAQFTEMRSNSKQILSGLRWCLDFITLLFLGAIFYIYLSTGGANGGAPSMDGMGAFTRPTLWIASIYALLFSSETWLRLRGRLPKPTLD